MEPRSIWHKCGECGRDLNSPNYHEVCPECGAKMIPCNNDGSDMSQDEFRSRYEQMPCIDID